MTRKRADEIIIEVWTWLAKHPGKSKSDLPTELYLKIGEYLCSCPWCSLYLSDYCRNCPLFDVHSVNCGRKPNSYFSWCASRGIDSAAAWEIVAVAKKDLKNLEVRI